MEFTGHVELGGKTATGIEVPESVITALGDSKRPAVVVTIGEFSYRTTAARMGGRYLVPLSAENRTAAGLTAGDPVTVDIVLDAQPREIALPADLAAAMDPAAHAFFAGLAAGHRKEWVRWVEEAKRPETRATRVARTAAALSEGRSTRS